MTSSIFHKLPAKRRMLSIIDVSVSPGHICDHDLERYHLGMVTEETGLATLEQHLICCPTCVNRAEESADYVDTLRVGIINVNRTLYP